MPPPSQPFSKRQGYSLPPDVNPEKRNEAPDALRDLVRESASRWGISRTPLRDLTWQLTKVDIGTDEKHLWSHFWGVLHDTGWFGVYDVIEAVYAAFEEDDGIDTELNFVIRDGSFPKAPGFERDINECLIENGIPWQLVDGQIVIRGNEAFERTIKIAEQELADRETARTRIQEAVDDLSRRPEPDLTGAISHAFAAMECIIGDIEYTPEEIRQDTQHTFGKFLQRHGDLFPSEDFKDGFQRLWKYANNEGSRHGKEGVEPARDEAELVVSLAAALVTYLNRKHPK